MNTGTANTTNTTAKIKNRPNSILPRPAEPAATPPKPKAPAVREIKAKMMAYFTMSAS
jgi:hypothetical protein